MKLMCFVIVGALLAVSVSAYPKILYERGVNQSHLQFALSHINDSYLQPVRMIVVHNYARYDFKALAFPTFGRIDIYQNGYDSFDVLWTLAHEVGHCQMIGKNFAWSEDEANLEAAKMII